MTRILVYGALLVFVGGPFCFAAITGCYFNGGKANNHTPVINSQTDSNPGQHVIE